MSLSPLYAAALDLQTLCHAQGWSFCFIGGIAVQRWAIERLTKDADLTLMTRFVNDEAFARVLMDRFEAVRGDALDFAIRTRVLFLRHENGITMDVALGALDFEERSVGRASRWRRRDGATLLTCCAEDLIVHKAFASRNQDWVDVDNVIAVQREKLDLDLIFEELRPLAALKEDDGIITQLEWRLKRRGLR